MKKFFAFLLTSIVLQTLPASAFVIESKYTKNENGQYVKITEVTCSSESREDCYNLCQHESNCQRQEPYCRNCAGTTSPLLRQLFTEISRYFTLKSEIVLRDQLVRYMAAERFVLIDMKSIFNYYTPVGGDAFLKELRSFCGENVETTLLAVQLDNVHQPEKLSYVLCRDQNNQTVAYEAQPRLPEFGHKTLNVPIIFQLN